jgi:DMSO/TMAO reductase YedYZ molybdopterin-dependent catalytic subunit
VGNHVATREPIGRHLEDESMNGNRGALAVACLILVPLTHAPAGRAEPPGTGSPASVLVRVEGEVPKKLALTAEVFSRLPRREVRARGHDGKEAVYAGVPVVEVLQAAGVKFGHDLRGPALASYLVVEAADGYRAVFALPELDPACTDRVILLADRRDGQSIDAKEGPLRVVVPGEKRHARWVRQVVTLRVGRA